MKIRTMTVILALATLLPVAVSAQQRGTAQGTRRTRPGAATAARGNRTRPDSAQARRGRDGASDPVLERILQMDKLNLTEDQVTKLRAVSEKTRTERQKEIAEHRKDMQKGDTPTDEQREKMKTELRKTQEKTRKELLEVLTKEQRQIVEEQMKARRGGVSR